MMTKRPQSLTTDINYSHIQTSKHFIARGGSLRVGVWDWG